MIVYKCDRCKAESNEPLSKLTIDLVTDILQINQNTAHREYDLCDICLASVKHLLQRAESTVT